MTDKKHIDRLFQEKLKNFEATPNDAVWERISTQLGEEGGESKVIPIWWRIGGIAAGLLLLIAIGYSIVNNSTTNPVEVPTEIVDTNNTKSESTIDEVQNKEVTEANDVGVEDATDAALKNNLVPRNQITTSQENASQEGGVLNVLESIVDKDDKNTSSSAEEGIANTKQPNKNSNDPMLNANANNRKVIDNATHTDIAQEEQSNPENDPSATSTVSNAVAINSNTENLPEQTPDKENITREAKEVTSKPSIPDGVAVANISSVEEKEKEKEDINNITEETSPSIEEAVASSEDGEDYDEKEKEVIDRWSVTPNVSPVYYNTLGKGSSIHEQFNKNSKSGQLNMSYGVKAGYAITDRLSIRSGVNKMDLGYNTNDVIIYQSLSPSTGGPLPPAAANNSMRNIDLKEEVQGITVISRETIAFSQVPSVVSQNLQSSLNQELSFIEVPLEIEYTVSDKNLNVSLIGGFSTLFLTDNSVYTDFNDERTLLGEANNIKNVSYSANFGVGLGVKISEKVNLNFEPNFKYQINAFNNTSGDFKPYILGVNTGLKFKF